MLEIIYQFPDNRIGRVINALVNLPQLFPRLNAFDYYLWQHLKSIVNLTIVENEEQLRQRIQDTTNNIRSENLIIQSFDV